MRVPSIFYTTSVRKYQKKSVYKIYRKTENGWKILENVNKNEIHKPAIIGHNQIRTQEQSKAKSDDLSKDQPNHRENEMKIQMLSKSLYEQIFMNNHKPTPDEKTIKK